MSLKIRIWTVLPYLILFPPPTEWTQPIRRPQTVPCQSPSMQWGGGGDGMLSGVLASHRHWRCSLHFVVALGKSHITAKERSRVLLNLAVNNLKLAARDGCVREDIHHSFRDQLPKISEALNWNSDCLFKEPSLTLCNTPSTHSYHCTVPPLPCYKLEN